MYDSNRKQYINFSDIEQMIRDNEPVKVVDNVTGEDITRQILVQLIMRNEPSQSDTRVPLEGLKDMLQNNEGPIFQAFRNVLNIGRGMVQQMTSRPPAGEKSTDDATKASGSVFEIARGVVEKVSDSDTTLSSSNFTVKDDAVAALIGLGYNHKIADKAIRSLLESNSSLSLEDLIKDSLKNLNK